MPSQKFPGIGMWKLISCENRANDGTVTRPYDTGLIVYDAKGNMAAQVANAQRPRFTKNDQLLGTPSEIKTAFEGYVAYFGTYDFDMEKATVFHHVKTSMFPNFIGTDQIRYFELAGNRMILRTTPLNLGGKTIVGTLVWERIS